MRSATRYLAAWPSSSGWRAGSSASGVPGSTVRPYALSAAGRGRARRRASAPVVERLARRAVDEVEVERVEAGVAASATARSRWPDRACARARRARAAPSTARRSSAGSRRRRDRSSSSDAVTVSGLHSTVTSAPGPGAAPPSTHQRSAGTIDGVPPPKNTLVDGGQPVRDGPLDVGRDTRPGTDRSGATIRPGGERAVVAPARAERDVDVDAEGRRRGQAGTGRG